MPEHRLQVVNVLEEGAIGGPQRRSLAVASELNRREGTDGADTTLLIPDTADALKSACDIEGVRSAQLPIDTLSRKRAAAARYAFTFVPQVVRMSRWLRRADVDVVHVSGGAFCLKGPVASRLAGVPFLWHLNDTKSHPAVRRSFKVIAKICRPAHLIFAAHAVQASYADWLPAGVPGSVVPAPHRNDLVHLDAADLDDPYPPSSGQRILMLANINTVKGLDDALAAIELMQGNATLFIAGGVKATQDDYFDLLQAQVHDKNLPVVFLGHVSDVGPYLAHADISLCASLAEASPLSVWEAAAAGKPVVSTDVGDVARELPDQEAALIVPVGDRAAIAAALDRLVADAALRNQLGVKARERMKDATSVEQIATLSLATYRQAASKNGVVSP